MSRIGSFALVACALAALLPPLAAAARSRSAHAHRAHRIARPHRHTYRQADHRGAPVFAPGYGSDYDPTPTCRYADGTPYDPDIIGGPNHVGDGGPAVNLGGYNPCGY